MAPGSGTADVVVIGAGVIGLSIALEALRRDLSTTVVDRKAGPVRASTRASPGIVRFHAAGRQTAVLALEGYHCYMDWYDFVGVRPAGAMVRYQKTGSLLLEGTDGYAWRAGKVMSSLGVETVRCDGAILATEFPWMAPTRFGSGAVGTPIS